MKTRLTSVKLDDQGKAQALMQAVFDVICGSLIRIV